MMSLDECLDLIAREIPLAEHIEPLKRAYAAVSRAKRQVFAAELRLRIVENLRRQEKQKMPGGQYIMEPSIGHNPKEPESQFFRIDGPKENLAKFFIDGILPSIGDQVEIVATEVGEKHLIMQLRVKRD